MPNTYDDGNTRWSGSLGDIQYLNPPAPEREYGDYVTMVSGVDREPKPAPMDSGLQSRTENLPDGQIGDFKLSAMQ